MDVKDTNSNTKFSLFKLVKKEFVENLEVYNTYTNWIIGEFDLFLKTETHKLKVYFPNGWFSIRAFTYDKIDVELQITVKGKSKIDCEKIMKRLEFIYSNVKNFNHHKMELSKS